MMNNSSKIIIVDNHSLFREGLKLLIETEGIGEVIGEAGSGQEFLELLQFQKPDMIIMDFEMPFMNGIEASIKAIEKVPDLKILMLTMQDEKENYQAMIDAGVKGYAQKNAGKMELENAVKTVLKGKLYINVV